MYIPSLLFGATNSCISASGADSSGAFYSGSQIWEYYKFSSTGSHELTIHSGSTSNAKVLIVAGGGAGGFTEFNGEALNETAGGGGAGGVVFTDARLGPGSYNLYVGDGAPYSGSEGENSWININYIPTELPDAYAPTASQITAEGGGFGGYFLNINNTTTGKVDASAGGSGGGGCASVRFAPGGGYTIANSNGGRTNQGFEGGDPQGPFCLSSTERTATGGGGAGGASDDTDCITSAGYQTPGGEGLAFNVDGNPTWYAYGGASMRSGVWEAATPDTGSQSSRAYGAGGWGRSASYGSGNEARQGVIVVMVPACATECTTYQFGGGASGGTLEYIDCVTGQLQSSSLSAGENAVICNYVIPGQYPATTGTITSVISGSCNTETPFEPISGSSSCEAYIFAAGDGGGTATYTLCDAGGETTEPLSAGEEVVRCITSGSSRGISGAGSSINFFYNCGS